MTMLTKHFLFDFDGTLVDSMPTYVQTMLRILDMEDVPYPQDVVKIITPLGYAGTAKYFRDLGVKMPVEKMLEEMAAYAVDAYTHRIPAKAHVTEVLQELKKRGCDLSILTASPHQSLDPCLKRLGLDGLFTHIWSCDDFGTTKADPDIYIRAAEKIGAPAEAVLFLDDNVNACKTAKEAGMMVCGVYDDSSADCTEEIRQVADSYIDDFSQLLAL